MQSQQLSLSLGAVQAGHGGGGVRGGLPRGGGAAGAWGTGELAGFSLLQLWLLGLHAEQQPVRKSLGGVQASAAVCKAHDLCWPLLSALQGQMAAVLRHRLRKRDVKSIQLGQFPVQVRGCRVAAPGSRAITGWGGSCCKAKPRYCSLATKKRQGILASYLIAMISAGGRWHTLLCVLRSASAGHPRAPGLPCCAQVCGETGSAPAGTGGAGGGLRGCRLSCLAATSPSVPHPCAAPLRGLHYCTVLWWSEHSGQCCGAGALCDAGGRALCDPGASSGGQRAAAGHHPPPSTRHLICQCGALSLHAFPALGRLGRRGRIGGRGAGSRPPVGLLGALLHATGMHSQ